MYDGNDILSIAERHLGEPYVLGSVAPLANPNWTGPWDCAEFASWCAYQAYGIVFAVRPPDPSRGESYSGWWYEDALTRDCAVKWEEAVAIPGAILVRKPLGGTHKRIGHVAISRGDGTTIEAKGSATGVAIVNDTVTRPWDVETVANLGGG